MVFQLTGHQKQADGNLELISYGGDLVRHIMLENTEGSPSGINSYGIGAMSRSCSFCGILKPPLLLSTPNPKAPVMLLIFLKR